MPLLDVDGLTLCAHRKRILDGVSFRIERGETFALVGESGSGKSMTSLAIMRLLPTGITVSEGDIRFEKMSLFACTEREMCRIRGKRIAMIFQEPMNALNPVRRVGDQIDEAVRLHTRAVGDEVKRTTLRLLEEVGMIPADSFYSRFPHQLSGGQKQRVMIAMALAGDPELLIADEPTTALDVTVQAQILRLLRRIGEERMLSVLFITHDLAVVAQVAHRIGVLKEGKVVEIASTDKFFRMPSHPYSISLLRHAQGVSHTTQARKERDVLMEVQRLRVVYERRRGWWRKKEHTEALKGIDLAVRCGETLALVGESGSGKSTVAKAIVGLVPIASGDIVFTGQRIERRDREFRRNVQMVFQDPFASLDPRMRIGEIIAEGMKATGVEVDDTEAYIKYILGEVELDPDTVHRYPHAFSGGQRQRIAIARALAVSPRLLILDEPTSALDVTTRGEMLTLLKRLQEDKGLSYLFITHDLALVSAFAHRVAVMREGDIVEEGDATTLMKHPQHPYTKTLLQSVPKIPRYER